jgi:hypothetical protein
MHSRTPWPRHFSLSSIKQVVSSNTADLKTTRFKSGGRLAGTGTYMYAHDCLQQRFASMKSDAHVITYSSTNRRAGQAKHAVLLILPAIRG